MKHDDGAPALKGAYDHPAPRHPALMPTLMLLDIVAGIGSLAIGAVSLSPARLLAVVTGHGDPIASVILFELRLPRAILGLLVGAMLGLAGAVLQGYLRNPLAEPSVLGASNSAALGAVAALYFGLAEWHAAMLPLMAIAAGLGALLLLFALAGKSDSPLGLILAGIAVSTLAGAGISLALNVSPNPFAAMDIMNWLLGSIENRSSEHVVIALPCILVGAALLLLDGRALDALSLGEDGARSLGVDLRRTRIRLLFGLAIGVGGA
ncbi:MAG: iron ABC transporter permease, partial [Sphingobium sp.]